MTLIVWEITGRKEIDMTGDARIQRRRVTRFHKSFAAKGADSGVVADILSRLDRLEGQYGFAAMSVEGVRRYESNVRVIEELCATQTSDALHELTMSKYAVKLEKTVVEELEKTYGITKVRELVTFVAQSRSVRRILSQKMGTKFKAIVSQLDFNRITGVGDKKSAELVTMFGSMAAFKMAGIGMKSKEDAQKLLDYWPNGSISSGEILSFKMRAERLEAISFDVENSQIMEEFSQNQQKYSQRAAT